MSLAVKGALYNTRIPRVNATVIDGGSVDLMISDDPFDSVQLDIKNVPLLVTLCKIGNHCIVDASAEEEECSSVSLLVAVSQITDKPHITNIRTIGSGSLHHETLLDSLKISITAAQSLNKALIRSLDLEAKKRSESKLRIAGFLK